MSLLEYSEKQQFFWKNVVKKKQTKPLRFIMAVAIPKGIRLNEDTVPRLSDLGLITVFGSCLMSKIKQNVLEGLGAVVASQ